VECDTQNIFKDYAYCRCVLYSCMKKHRVMVPRCSKETRSGFAGSYTERQANVLFRRNGLNNNRV